MDNWEDLLNEDIDKIEIKKKTNFDDEDKEDLAKKSKPEQGEIISENKSKESEEKKEKKSSKKEKEVPSKSGEKLIKIVDPFGVPNPKDFNNKPTYDDKRKAEE